MSYFSIHNHTYMSNYRLRDSVNKPEDVIMTAIKKGIKGVAITDHETIAAGPQLMDFITKGKEDGTIPEDFVFAMGNEAYLIDDSKRELVEAQEKVRYNHFILIAKNQRGWDFLKKQTSQAWANNIYSRGMERVPTYKSELKQMMQDYKGDVIASTACIGGELPQLILQMHEAEKENDKNLVAKIKGDIHTFISYLIEVFGKDNVYFELQPSRGEEQLIVNEWLPKIGAAYDIKCIVSTDAHYLTLEQQEFHKQYLQASEGEREVESFYATTYIFSEEELLEYFEQDLLNVLMTNTLDIRNKIEPINYKHLTVIPRSHIPDFENDHIQMMKNLKGLVDENKYENIYKMARSERVEDRYYNFLIFNGMKDKNQEFNEENLSRIDLEYGELLAITEQLNQPMTSYFLAMKEFVDIMWLSSLVGVGRGSAVCYYTNYLLDIVMLNPIKYDLPHWRFLAKEYVGDFPDIDVDAQGSQREEIIKNVKESFGYDNVLNIGTYTTEGPRAASLTACRSYGLDPDTSQNITNMIPQDKGVSWNLSDAFFGNEEENKKPAAQLINEVEKYPGLKELMLQSQGLVSGRGQHASGVVIFPDGYTSMNAMMKTSKGLPITQFDAKHTELAGGIKYDFLSINALDRIRSAFDMLLKDGIIEWQGSLRKTFNKYFHPDVLEMDAQKMYDLLFDGEIISAFQFEAKTGRTALEKINARNFNQLVAANSLMRLSCEGEQPIDKFIRYKNDLNEWEKDMIAYNLTEEERQVMHELLDDRYGVCETQEAIMQIAMHDKVAKYDLLEAKKLRKASAKKDPEIQRVQKEHFFEKGLANGTRREMLEYIWQECYVPTFGYSFSSPHVVAYTMILMIEMNIAYRYGVHYWKAACLNVDSGIIGDSDEGTKYGKIAKALTNFKEEILPPDVNKSEIGFTPDKNTGKILFGLKPIVGVNSAIAQQIIDNRPYNNIVEFYEKNVKNGMLTDGKMITLIKAGIFDQLYQDRKKLMYDFICYINPLKEKMTTTVIPKILDRIPQEHKEAATIYMFQRALKSNKTHDQFADYYFTNYQKLAAEKVTKKYPNDYNYDENGKLVIELKVFEKLVKDKMEGLKEWLNSPEGLKAEAALRRAESWKKYCKGTVEHWEMESISFYINDHELKDYPLYKYFDIANFYEMPREPEIVGYSSARGGKKWPKFKTYVIAGTVIDSLPKKGIVTIITENGVVDVRVGKGKYQYYNKKIIVGEGNKRVNIDDTWFKRGTILVAVGYRRENDFYANSKNSSYQHSLMKIDGVDLNGGLIIQQEKRREE